MNLAGRRGMIAMSEGDLQRIEILSKVINAGQRSFREPMFWR
jgi:hypothetical protein